MATKSRAGGKLAGNTVRIAPVYRGQVDRMFTKESVMARLQEAEPRGAEVVDVRRDEGRIYFTLVRHDTGAILETVASEWVVVVLPEDEAGAGKSYASGYEDATREERAAVVAFLDGASGTLDESLDPPIVAAAIRDLAVKVGAGMHRA